MAALSIVCHHGGFLHYEAERRLPFYLSSGPVLEKLYDSDYLDWGLYQARELSCFFDYLDCQFIAICVTAGHPHFLSLTHYVFLLFINLVLWRFGVDEIGLGPWFGGGVLQLLWTSPAFFLGGVFFRSSKIGLALVVVILYWRIFCFLRGARENPAYHMSARSWFLYFGMACAAMLFDRQGVFMVGVILIFLGIWFYGCRRKSVLTLMGAFAAALVFGVIYNYIVDPLITLSLEHYWPDFKYQHLPWKVLEENPGFFATSSLSLYFDTVRYFLGNVPLWAAVILVAVLAYSALPEGLGLVVSQTFLIWVMIVLMILRHNALLWPDVRRGYYFLPVISMFAMTLLLWFSRVKVRYHVPKWFLGVALALAIVGNIIALPGHDTIMKTESLSASFKSTPVLLDALRDLHNPRYVIPSEVATNRVFRYFHDGYFSKTGR